MNRRLANLLTVLSVLLCAAILLAWLRSYLPRGLHLGSHDGRLLLMFTEDQWSDIVAPADREPGYADLWQLARGEAAAADSVLGVEYVTRLTPTSGLPGFGGNRGRFFLLAVPYGYLLLVPAAGAAGSAVLLRRHRRRSRVGACTNCGYDLRATPDKCPECGHAARASTAGRSGAS